MQKLINRLKHERRIIFIEYFVLALAVMLPLLLPGFVLMLDMVFTPNIAFPDSVTNAWPLQFVLWFLGLVLPASVVQKILLLAILTLSGAGMHLLVRTAAAHKLIVPAYLKWGAYFAGIFYMVNPFTYSRFMAGQWMVLLGYALLPFFVLSVIRLIAKPGGKTALAAALWAAALTMVSVHHIGIAAIVGVVAMVLAVWKFWGQARLKRILLWGLAGLGLFVLLNSFWLAPAALGNDGISQPVSSFDRAHHEAFKTDDTGPFGAAGNVLRLQGFWLEPRQMFLLPQDKMPLWGLITIFVWVLVGIGAATGWRTQRFSALLMALAGLAGILLASVPIIAWASDVIPLLNGYREPHKFVNLLVLAYAYFGALGTLRLLGWAHQHWQETGANTALIVLLLLPVALTPTMLWGFGGQLKPRQYPPDWFAINRQLNQLDEGRALFLPWHQYMHFDFARRIIANPADKFFDKKVIISDDPEFGDIKPPRQNRLHRQIEKALTKPETMAQALAAQDIRFVLLAKDSDYKDYGYLDEAPGLRLINETANLKLYEVKKI